MRVYFVGGFLGSGKTTAIAGACRLLIAGGARVGVVTNDQGKLQVDSLFMKAAGFPTVEVGGGCFCCRYDDFDAKLASLVAGPAEAGGVGGQTAPDAIFAESVGSCADIVATVVKPFESFRASYGARSVFSVFADSRLLLARLSGARLPFSEDVIYLFDRQLEEAELLVLNKRDLVDEAARLRLRELAAAAWPGKPLIEISGQAVEGAAAWLAALNEAAAAEGRSRGAALDIDYARYGAGERELSWLDERLVIEDGAGLASDGRRCRAAVLAFALALARGLEDAALAVGHVKLQVSAPGYERKLSLTAGDFLEGAAVGGAAVGACAGMGLAVARAASGLEALLATQLPPFTARRVDVSLNARVQCGPGVLAGIASRAASAAGFSARVTIAEQDRSAFRPGLPVPTHRMG